MTRLIYYAGSRGLADELLAQNQYLDGEQKEMCSTHSEFVLKIGDLCYGHGGINGTRKLSDEEDKKYAAAEAFKNSLPSLKEL